jgi:hypothetical protein
MPVGNPSFGEIASTTLNEHAALLANNIFDNQPYMYWLQQGERVKDFNGGNTIVEPIIHGKNTTVATYAGYDTLAVTAQTGLTAASFDVKQAFATIAIDGFSQMQNAGPQEVIDLLEAKMMQTQESITDFFDEMLINSDGTGNSGKDWLGLLALIGDGTVGPTTVGGIDASDALNSWWRSSLNNAASSALLLSDMATMTNDCSNGTDRPDLILTSQKQYEAYEALLTPQQMFRDESIANAGFRNLLYKDVPVVYDAYVPDDKMLFLNSKYLKLRPNRKTWFTTTPFVRPHNQDAVYAQVLMGGQQTVNSRRRQGMIYGIA